MAIALDRSYDDWAVLDVLEECDQLARGLNRLRRQGRLGAEDWRVATQHLAQTRQLVGAELRPCSSARPTGHDPATTASSHPTHRSSPWNMQPLSIHQ